MVAGGDKNVQTIEATGGSSQTEDSSSSAMSPLWFFWPIPLAVAIPVVTAAEVAAIIAETDVTVVSEEEDEAVVVVVDKEVEKTQVGFAKSDVAEFLEEEEDEEDEDALTAGFSKAEVAELLGKAVEVEDAFPPPPPFVESAVIAESGAEGLEASDSGIDDASKEDSVVRVLTPEERASGLYDPKPASFYGMDEVMYGKHMADMSQTSFILMDAIIKEGLFSVDENREKMACIFGVIDDRTCPICLSYIGLCKPVHELPNPPFHKNCRCAKYRV